MKQEYTKFTLLIFCSMLLCSNSLFSQGFENVFLKAEIEHFSQDDDMMVGSVIVIDYNNDGYDDILMIGGNNYPTRLFRNNPQAYETIPYDYKNMFTDVSDLLEDIELYFTMGGGVFDYNNDGWSDLFITTGRGDPSLVYKNEGGTFTEVGDDLGFIKTNQSTSVSFGDVNKDGWIDVYVSNYFEDKQNNNCLANLFYINRQGNRFDELSFSYSVNDKGCGLAASFSDYDNDGDVDLLVANDFGQSFTSNAIYRNEYPVAIFNDVKTQVGFDEAIFGMGIEGGDYDNDGDLDYYATNLGENYFYDNQNGQIFIERGKELDIDNTYAQPGNENSGFAVSWGINWFDYDLDMDLDLHVANGYLLPLPDLNVDIVDNNRLFRNDGKGKKFVEVTEEMGLMSPGLDRGSAQIDFDKDGDMDLLTTITRPEDYAYGYQDNEWFKLMENKQNTGRSWLNIKLKGTTVNSLAIGSRVSVYTDSVRQIREVTSGGGGYMSQSTRVLNFGLMDYDEVDSIVVNWMGSDIKTRLYNIPTKQYIDIVQPYYDTVNVELCYGESMFDRVWKESSFHYESKPSISGADSNIVYKVEVFPPDSLTAEVGLCHGESFLDEIWEEAGEKYITYINRNGCDSVVKYVVDLIPSTEQTTDTSICYSSYFLGKQYISDTTVTMNLKNELGCDSIINYNVTVLEAPNYTEHFNVCYGDIFKGKIIIKQEIFSNRFTSEQNCDSVHSIVVTPLQESRFRDSLYLDYGDSYKGKIWEEDGLYSEKIDGGAFNGCDSLFIVDVFVTKTDVYNTKYDNKLNIKVVPNPFESISYVEFEIDDPTGLKVELVNQIGKSIALNYNANAGLNKIKLDSKELKLNSGVYFLKITTLYNTYVTKIIKGK